MMFSVKKWSYPLLLLLLVSFALEFLVRSGIIPSYLFPRVSQMVISVWTSQEEFKYAIEATLMAAFLGLFLSLTSGLLFSVILIRFQFLRLMFLPYAVFFQTVPIVSIAPILVIWFGFGLSTVVACSFIVSFFPILANTLAGLESTDPHLLELFRLHQVSPGRTILWLRLPGAVPQIFTGIQIAAGLSLIGALVGEFISGGGLGGLIDLARTQQRIDKVFAAVLLASLLGVALLTGIKVIQITFFKRWNASS